MVDPSPEAAPRRPLSKRLQPWIDGGARLLAAIASAMAIWRGLH
jgi:hypothetical protein